MRFKGQLVLFFIFLVIAVVTFVSLSNDMSTCFDGQKNGDESGIDCGGECVRVCLDTITPLEVIRTELYEGTEFTFNVLTYVRNRNENVTGYDIPFTTTLTHRESGEVIDVIEDTFTTDTREEIILFSGHLVADHSVPVMVETILEEGSWEKGDRNRHTLKTLGNDLGFSEQGTRLEATLENTSLDAYSNVEVIAFLYDGTEVRNISRTNIEYIGGGNSKSLIFTWPKNYEGAVTHSDVRVIQYNEE